MEKYEDTQKMTELLVNETPEISEIHKHVDYIKQLGRGRGTRPIHVQLTTFSNS
jgi:hypothetical protein